MLIPSINSKGIIAGYCFTIFPTACALIRLFVIPRRRFVESIKWTSKKDFIFELFDRPWSLYSFTSTNTSLCEVEPAYESSGYESSSYESSGYDFTYAKGLILHMYLC